MEQGYPWYRLAEPHEELEQGDCIDDCQVVIPTYIPNETKANVSNDSQVFHVKGVVQVRDVIIITQSCDLENGKVDFVHLCPRITYSQFVEAAKNGGKNTKTILGNLNEIRLGRSYRYYMLDKCDLLGFIREIQIVDLGTSFTIPYDIVKQMVRSSGNRIRLLSPYKEQLAQVFGFFYMRVAQPNSIDEFRSLATPMHIGTTP